MPTIDLQHRIQKCRDRFAASPQGRAFAPLADVLRMDGQYAEALEVLEDGLSRHQDFLAAKVILGHTLLDADRSGHARKVLHSILDQDPDNCVVLRLLTEDSRSRQDWNAAIPLLERLAQLDPDDERWLRALSEARANRNRPDPSDVPETSFATMTLVDIYLAQGYRAKALAALRQMHERDPHRADIVERIAEMGTFEANTELVAESAGQTVAVEVEPGVAVRREVAAAKRAQEKENFSSWIHRIRDDESPQP